MYVRKRMMRLRERCGGRDICMLQLTVQVHEDASRGARCKDGRFEEAGKFPSFLSLHLGDLRHQLGERLIRGGAALVALCVDELIDPAGVEDHRLVLAPIGAADAQAGEKSAFATELSQRGRRDRSL